MEDHLTPTNGADRRDRLQAIKESHARCRLREVRARAAAANAIVELLDLKPPAKPAPAPAALKCQYKGPDKRAKVNPEIVLEIRRRIQAGDRQNALAKAFGVSTATICGIGSRRIWAWVEEGASE